MSDDVKKILDPGNMAAIAALMKGDMSNAIVAASPGGIEAQERAGQTVLLASTHLPKDLNPSREAFEQAGITFGEDVDNLFLHAMLPHGWARRPGGNAYWSTLVDTLGRDRVDIFSKAAFYDRSAHARLLCRYTLGCVTGSALDENAAEGYDVFVVRDAGEIVYQAPGYAPGDWPARRLTKDDVFAWLMAQYPDWENPLAYW